MESIIAEILLCTMGVAFLLLIIIGSICGSIVIILKTIDEWKDFR